MLHSFGHHVARCCMMLDDVERRLISIKHRLQHHPTFLLFLSVNKNVAFVSMATSCSIVERAYAHWADFELSVSMVIVRCLYLLRAFRTDVKTRYGEWETTSNLSANRKRQGKAEVGKPKTVESRRWCDTMVTDLSNYWKKDHVCGMYFARTIMSPFRLIPVSSLSSFHDSITLLF